MKRYTAREGNVTIVLNPDVISKALEDVGSSPVTRMASDGATVARNAVPETYKRYIGIKQAIQFDLESGRLSKLSRMLRIPVALIVNDSFWASSIEYGDGRGTRQYRPLSAAFEALRGRASLAVRGRGRR